MSPTSYRAAPPRGDESQCNGGVTGCQLDRRVREGEPPPSPCPLPFGGEGWLERLAARAIVAVELAAGVDGDADARLRACGLEVMPAVLGAEHEVARAGTDGRGLILDVPVDLALEHHPPLVVQMVVRVVGLARRVANDESLDVVGQDHRLRPGWRAPLRLELAHTSVELADLHQGRAVGHVTLLGRSGAAGASDAIGLAGLVAPRPHQAQQYAPGAARG